LTNKNRLTYKTL